MEKKGRQQTNKIKKRKLTSLRATTGDRLILDIHTDSAWRLYQGETQVIKIQAKVRLIALDTRHFMFKQTKQTKNSEYLQLQLINRIKIHHITRKLFTDVTLKINYPSTCSDTRHFVLEEDWDNEVKWIGKSDIDTHNGGGRIFFSRVNFLCWLLFRYPFHPRVTAVARKRPRSFCQKCRWQVTAEHAYTLRMWLCMKWHGAWLYGVHRTRRDGSSFMWHQPCQRCKYTTLVDIQKCATKSC